MARFTAMPFAVVRTSERPARLRGVLLTIALLAMLVAQTGTSANAAPASVSLARGEPLSADLSTFFAGREAARSGGPDLFKIKGDLWLLNTGSSSLEVSEVDISYPGSSVGGVTTIPTTQQILDPGVEGRVRIFDGLYRELPEPLPPSIRFVIKFVATSDTAELNFDLAFYSNDTATGGQLFPALASDLEPGEFWAYGTRHIDDATGNQQPSTVRDRYAYDLVVVRWDGSAFTTQRADSNGNSLPNTSNDNDLSFGKPLYATDDGVVVVCSRGNPDNSVPGVEDAGLNELYIQYGDEMVRYAHLQADSIPPRLCPNGDGASHDVEALNITVTPGERIGNVGNNGQSTGPHLHMSVHHRPDRTAPADTSFAGGDSRPQGFHNIRIASDPASINNLGPNPTFHAINGPILPSNTLLLPNPCGLDVPTSGLTELARHGVDGTCYQDRFNLDVQAGYRPVFVDGYDAAGGTGFNVVYRSGGTQPAASVAAHSLLGNDFQELFDDLTADGYRLHSNDSHIEAGVIRYNPIFEIRSGPPWFAYHGLTTEEHDAQVVLAHANGFVPVRVSAADPGDGPRWTAVYEQVATESWDIVESSSAGYQAAFDAQVGLGRIPVHVEGHQSPAGARIVGVFVEPVGGSSSAVHGASGPEYQDAYDEALGAGRLTRAVTGYEDGGQLVFAGVWRSAVNSSFTSTPPPFTNSTTATFGFTADDPFASFGCRLDSAATFTPCTSPAQLSGLGEGSHTFAVRAADRDGVRDGSPASTSWVVDLTAPTVSIDRPEAGFTYAHDKPSARNDDRIHVVGHVTVVASAEDSLSGVSSVAFSVNGQPVPASEVSHEPGSSTWSFRFEPSQKGKADYDLGWTATDAAGNTASTVVAVSGVKTGKK